MADDEQVQPQEEQDGKTPPYGVFATFLNSIAQLAQGIPNRIDRSVFPGMAWNAQNQLMIGMRFLRLVNGDDKPTPSLHQLADIDEEKRKVQLAKIVRASYAQLFALDLMKTTPAELDQRMTEFYDVSGDTRLKAVRFFLTALAYLEIPVSPLFARTRGSAPGAPRRRRAATRPRLTPTPATPATPTPTPDDPAPSDGTSRTVTLTTGDTLTITASVDVLKLKGRDRQFVFDIIDKLDTYESENER